jgi:NAD(P)-dependent dehydrogenase (short-subunit alcohol dehydrogenase family)
MEFAGKQVLVTGGASGIGRAASLAFGKAGANVLWHVPIPTHCLPCQQAHPTIIEVIKQSCCVQGS